MSQKHVKENAPLPPEIPGYEFLECIGGGSQGAVFRARQISLDRIVAIKVAWKSKDDDPDFEKRFLREARLAAKLSHTNILQAIDSGARGKAVYFVMEYISGSDLLTVLKSRGCMTEREGIDLGLQVAQALRYAADRGIYHGDIKPENLVMSHDGTVKIVDFGIAGLIKHNHPRRHGTDGFIAPEVFAGQRPSERSDLFGLGATIFEMMTARMPNPGVTLRHLRPDVSPSFSALISRLLEPDPAKRPKDGDELAVALMKLPECRRSDVGVANKATTMRSRWRSQAKRAKIMSIVRVAMIIVIVVTVYRVVKNHWREGVEFLKRSTVADASPSQPAASEEQVLPESRRVPDVGLDAEPPSVDPSKGEAPQMAPDEAEKAPEAPEPDRIGARPVFETTSIEAIAGSVVATFVDCELDTGGESLSFELNDESGQVVDLASVGFKQTRSVDDSRRVHIMLKIPRREGRKRDVLRLRARHENGDATLEIRVNAENRAPEIVDREWRFTMAEGAEAQTIALEGSDPDGDPLKWTVDEVPQDLDVRVEGSSLLIAAKLLAGHDGRESRFVLTLSDGAGGVAKRTVVAAVTDTDQPCRFGIEAVSGCTVKRYPQWDVVLVAVGESAEAMLDLEDADVASDDHLTMAFVAGSSLPKGLALKKNASGTWSLMWKPSSTEAWGPRNLELNFGESGRAMELSKIRVQVLRVLENGVGKAWKEGDASLEWLRNHQMSDGRLACMPDDFQQVCQLGSDPCHDNGNYSQHVIGLTALAGLAGLRSGVDAPWIRKAADYMIKSQGDDGGISSDRKVKQWMYGHLIGAEVLALAWHFYGDPRYRKAAQVATSFTQSARRPLPDEGWGYQVRDRRSDSSVTVWAIRSLQASRTSRLDVDPVAIEAGFAWFDRMTDRETGRVKYDPKVFISRPPSLVEAFPPGESEAMTAGALSVRIPELAVARVDQVLRLGFELLNKRLPVWDIERGTNDFYYWQHAATALRALKLRGITNAPSLLGWNRLEQVLSAHVRRENGCIKGSFDPHDPWIFAGGRTYSTAMLTLALVNLEFQRPFVNEVAK